MQIKEIKTMIYLNFRENKIELKSVYDPEIVAICRSMPIRKWKNEEKVWRFPFTVENYEFLLKKLAFFPIDITPDLKKAYRQEKEEIEQLKKIKTNPDAKLKSKLSKKLYPFQRVGVSFLLLSSNTLLGDEMGIGKSIQALCFCEEIKAKKILIVCPNSLKFVWANEIEKWLGKEEEIEIYNGSALNLDKRFNIINYEALRLERNFNLQKINWDIVIADECHRGKSRKAQQTKALKKIPAQRKVGLSGTPILNRPDELWSILNWLRPKIYTSYWRFFEQYVDYWDGRFGKVVTGSKNLDQLKKELEPIMIRRTKKEVLPDLPEKTYQNIYVELELEQRRIYKEMKKDFIAKLNENEEIKASAVIAQIIRLKQIAIHPSLLLDDYDKNLPSKKLETLFEIIEDTDKKIVVFSQFARAIKIIEEELKIRKIGYAKIVGEVKSEQREKEIERFQNNESCRIFIGTIQAGGQGITLTAADTVIFLDPYWVEKIEEQAVDRLHRLGQKNNVTVIRLIAKNTIEEYVLSVLKKKKVLFDSIFNNKEEVLNVLRQQAL